jgi:hypothetical protein
MSDQTRTNQTRSDKTQIGEAGIGEAGIIQSQTRLATVLERKLLTASFLAALASLAAFAITLGATWLTAQAPASANPSSPAGQSSAAPVHRRPHTVRQAKPSPAAPAVPAPLPAAPVAPPPPNWPINDKPAAATVVWDSHGLTIDADNSSLGQILKEVSTDTGAKVEGLDTDQRVFGSYGPGPTRQVLSELLDGTGYNVLMFGDQGEGTPREIVLSAPATGPAPANQNRNNLANEEDYVEPEPEPMPQPEPVQNQFQPPPPQPGMPPRTPQEIQQLMQQRQQQIEQQQNENQQPNNQQ